MVKEILTSHPSVANQSENPSSIGDNNQLVDEEIVKQFEPVVLTIVGRLKPQLVAAREDPEDAVQEGMIGLLDALDKFDDDQGNEFTTYAWPRIRGQILDAVRRMNPTSRKQQKLSSRIGDFELKFEQENGRVPTDQEISEGTDLSTQLIRELKEIPIGCFVSEPELETINNERHLSLIDQDPTVSPEESLAQKEETQAVHNALKRLSEKDQRIITMYYFQDMTVREIAQELGVCPSRISQRRSRATASLKRHLQNTGLFPYSTENENKRRTINRSRKQLKMAV